jgi:hypothetical protein
MFVGTYDTTVYGANIMVYNSMKWSMDSSYVLFFALNANRPAMSWYVTRDTGVVEKKFSWTATFPSDTVGDSYGEYGIVCIPSNLSSKWGYHALVQSLAVPDFMSPLGLTTTGTKDLWLFINTYKQKDTTAVTSMSLGGYTIPSVNKGVKTNASSIIIFRCTFDTATCGISDVIGDITTTKDTAGKWGPLNDTMIGGEYMYYADGRVRFPFNTEMQTLEFRGVECTGLSADTTDRPVVVLDLNRNFTVRSFKAIDKPKTKNLTGLELVTVGARTLFVGNAVVYDVGTV